MKDSRLLKFSRSQLIILSLLVILVTSGCSKTSTPEPFEYPKATMELLLQEDSTSLSYAVWASSGRILYIAYPQDSDSSNLWELNPETGSSRLIKEDVDGPISVSNNGKIAAVENSNTIVVIDSTGEIFWQKYIGYWILSLAFSSDNNGIFFCKNDNLLFVTLNDSSLIDTIILDAGPFRITQNDSIIIYRKESIQGGNTYHTYYKYKFFTGVTNLILKENYTEGFDINPVLTDILAIGVMGSGDYQFMGRRIFAYNMKHSIGRIFEAYPYDESYIYVSSWSPEGDKVLLIVTPYIQGDPIIPLSDELWIAKDIL
ncbi:hypothetical protein KAU34_09340 [candidate division WOR-3 bacterium]|nr:hypothetical protein [candidate division WOR-3 bacterium]MCK4576597.1 hypothetical protein [candidate division WOR-3 bacterium]